METVAVVLVGGFAPVVVVGVGGGTTTVEVGGTAIGVGGTLTGVAGVPVVWVSVFTGSGMAGVVVVGSGTEGVGAVGTATEGVETVCAGTDTAGSGAGGCTETEGVETVSEGSDGVDRALVSCWTRPLVVVGSADRDGSPSASAPAARNPPAAQITAAKAAAQRLRMRLTLRRACFPPAGSCVRAMQGFSP